MAELFVAVLTSVDFLWGLFLGAIAYVVGVAMARSGKWQGPSPAAAALFTVAVVVALTITDSVGMRMGVGVGFVWLGAEVGKRVVDQWWGATAGAGVGSLVLATLVPGDLPWLRLLLVVGVPVAGWAMSDFESRHGRSGLGIACLAASVMGVFLTIPDTEAALSMLGVATGVFWLGWPRPLAFLGGTASYGVAAVYLVITGLGGVERASSIIGGVACLGLLVIEPIYIRVRTRRPPAFATGLVSEGRSLVLFAIHVCVVLLASRWLGRFPTMQPALMAVAFVSGAACLCLATFTSRSSAAD